MFLAQLVCAQLNVNTTYTPAALVNDILVGQGITVSNLTFNGAPANTINDQIGAFNGSTSNIGLNDGIVLATGRVVGVTGSNQNSSLTVSPSAPVNVADPDLALIETMQRCVAVLEFDFVPTGDSVSFRFVFGSEEYPEYVCSQYNDVFGFFLSGPGLNGPFSNDAVNLGVLPNSVIPIAINTVNSGSPGVLGGGASGCSASDPNWQTNSVYYIDNAGGPTVELDGFTVPIRTGAAVQCGQTYHIKIAIAHAGDASLDSAVFIEGGSFSSNSAVTISATTPQRDGTLTEGCGDALIALEVPARSMDANIILTYSGNDVDATDISGQQNSITIPAGMTTNSFPLSAISDELPEDSETLTIMATWTSSCGFTVTDSITIDLLDYVPLEIISTDLQLGCDQDSVRLDASVNGGLGAITTSWENGDIGDHTFVPGLENGSYTVTATDECPRTTTLDINVHSGCGIFVPNVITPNNDGNNDAWVIDGLQRSKHTVTVFNRWGQVVFESRNYNNTWRATGVSDGTYFYEIISDRSQGPVTGTLTILSNGRP
ncbi:MAG: gliding motility-associated C-terminal domain-containing protein [Flavobacteriales bacterium]|nr:gliding motility-associated C-terminal domain-containing protein [Flavobacteriales bacterium]